ncbi:unnamed protein product [Symbiodinium necroappetens]|uniref:Uncharacterized protein n=1 Tax=Symbiodinium necroappetens TaxID=1628268 RepID=A0A812PFW0_9DINO|nr:unnamed protein product [Symbiodinium necroappetens]
MVVKVCLIVLGVMGIVVVLDDSIQDHGDYQHLAHLDRLVASLSGLGRSDDLCAAATGFAEASPHRLLMAGIGPLLWTQHSCECCAANTTAEFDGTWLQAARRAMRKAPFQAHELRMVCYPNEDCSGSPSSVAVLDTHESVRGEAEADIVYTFIVVVLMVVFALAFMHALNKNSGFRICHQANLAMTGFDMAAKEDAPRFSQWRRVTALAGVALGTCLLAPLAVSCDARSSLTGELCEPAQNSGNLRGRRLSAHHIVHHVYGAGQHVMQHAYGAGSSVAHHVYGAGSSMMNHVYGAGSHVVHHVYHSGCMGLKIRRKSTSSPDTTATTSSVEVESTISDQIRSATATTTVTPTPLSTTTMAAIPARPTTFTPAVIISWITSLTERTSTAPTQGIGITSGTPTRSIFVAPLSTWAALALGGVQRTIGWTPTQWMGAS